MACDLRFRVSAVSFDSPGFPANCGPKLAPHERFGIAPAAQTDRLDGVLGARSDWCQPKPARRRELAFRGNPRGISSHARLRVNASTSRFGAAANDLLTKGSRNPRPDPVGQVADSSGELFPSEGPLSVYQLLDADQPFSEEVQEGERFLGKLDRHAASFREHDP